MKVRSAMTGQREPCWTTTPTQVGGTWSGPGSAGSTRRVNRRPHPMSGDTAGVVEEAQALDGFTL